MDFFEINKFVGALLATVLAVLALGMIADYIFEPEAGEQPGYVIAVADSGSAAEAEAPVEEKTVPLPTMLANADLANGEKQMGKCKACHTWDKGGPDRVGPNLWGVIGRQPGSHGDFNYSGAMAEFGQGKTWDFDMLNVYLHNPKDEVPGNKMSFAGIKKDQARADVIAFLRQQSDNPVPLPSPAESASAEGTDATAAEAPAGEAPAAAPEEQPAE